jgi:hypothetical protein
MTPAVGAAHFCVADRDAHAAIRPGRRSRHPRSPTSRPADHPFEPRLKHTRASAAGKSTHAPEPDFALHGNRAIVLGEAKWSAKEGKQQGILGTTTQMQMRRTSLLALASEHADDRVLSHSASSSRRASSRRRPMVPASKRA